MAKLFAVVCMMLALPAVAARAQFDSDGRWAYHEGAEPAHLIVGERYSAELADEMRARWSAIGELEPGATWAGDYFQPFGELGTTILRFDPENGYVRLTTHSCRPDVRRFDFGRVVETSEAVHLVPESPDGAATVYVKVTWGERRYLVDRDAIEAFCDAMAGLRVVPQYALDETSERFFSREGDGDRAVVGTPVVPARYAHFVKAPIAARVLAVRLKKRTSASARYTVLLDRGRVDGVQKGFEFVYGTDLVPWTVRIVQVGVRWSEATVEVYPDGEEDAGDGLPVVGATLSTCYACR